MSGFAGLVGPHCGDAERDWLEQATRFMHARGPDGHGTWHGELAVLGHTLLATTPEEAGSRQPLSLDGDTWLTGDIRLDARAELVKRLAATGRTVSLSRPDAELVLHAWHAWGERCLEYLAGDFAFVIWDQRSRRLFGARDQFGVSQFFYTVVGDQLLFSNTLEALLLHPGVSDALDETALGDYLVSGWACEPAATVFAAIRRLPAAHCLNWSPDRLEIRRYWNLPPAGPLLRYSRPEEYAEHFLALLTDAVSDRIGGGAVSTQLSGGMDSSSITAVAQRVLVASGKPSALHAVTIDYSGLMPDREAGYAGDTANQLGIETEIVDAAAYSLEDPNQAPIVLGPIPHPFAQAALGHAVGQASASEARVALSGVGGDPLLRLTSSYWIEWIARGHWGRLMMHVWHHRRQFHRRLPLRHRAAFQELGQHRNATGLGMPEWFDPDFVARTGLVERQRQVWRQAARQQAAAGMADSPFWTSFFLWNDPGFSRLPLRYRHPFFDLRLVEFVRAIPPVPWLLDKRLLRDAMRSLLPDSVLERPKTLLSQYPADAAARQTGWPASWGPFVAASGTLGRFMRRDKLRATIEGAATAGPLTNLNLTHSLSVALWLHHWRRPSPGRMISSGEAAGEPKFQSATVA